MIRPPGLDDQQGLCVVRRLASRKGSNMSWLSQLHLPRSRGAPGGEPETYPGGKRGWKPTDGGFRLTRPAVLDSIRSYEPWQHLEHRWPVWSEGQSQACACGSHAVIAVRRVLGAGRSL